MHNKLTEELAICGFNTVRARCQFHPETINRLFLREDRFAGFTGICKDLAARKRPYKICDNQELEHICKTTHHQGVVAMIQEPVIEGMTSDDLETWAHEGLTGLVLHAVGNDHNLGAMARAAAFFGTRFIVLSDIDDEAQLTTAAYRVAEGGMEHIVFKTVHNTAAFLRAASKKIITIGADPRSRWRLQDMDFITSERGRAMGVNPGFAVVIGNEETGLPKEVKDECLCLMRISGTGNIESLNASHAAALFLNKLYEV
jgi:TrmH RNA methyltransferase